MSNGDPFFNRDHSVCTARCTAHDGSVQPIQSMRRCIRCTRCCRLKGGSIDAVFRLGRGGAAGAVAVAAAVGCRAAMMATQRRVSCAVCRVPLVQWYRGTVVSCAVGGIGYRPQLSCLGCQVRRLPECRVGGGCGLKIVWEREGRHEGESGRFHYLQFLLSVEHRGMLPVTCIVQNNYQAGHTHSLFACISPHSLDRCRVRGPPSADCLPGVPCTASTLVHRCEARRAASGVHVRSERAPASAGSSSR